jgi:hypothetical protein
MERGSAIFERSILFSFYLLKDDAAGSSDDAVPTANLIGIHDQLECWKITLRMQRRARRRLQRPGGGPTIFR